MRAMRRWYPVCVGLAAVFLMGLAAMTPADAAAYSLKVKVASPLVGVRRNVAVTVEGGALAAPLVKRTGPLGLVRFFGLGAGTYTVTPSKFGYRFIPASRLVTFSGDVLTRSVSFTPRRLPAVRSITADPAALTLSQTQEAEVTVTVVNANGFGIPGAPVTAVSSDVTLASVEPAVKTTDANGQAVFTVIAAGSVGQAQGAAQPLALGTCTVTFSTGGWRGTAVRTAQTVVTVNQAIEAVLWGASAHADASSEAFRHWDPAATITPVSCGKCHSKPGFLDFIADGTIDAAAATGTVIDCFACHDAQAWALTSVVFPSGKTVTGLGHEAICATCHQGTAAKITVDAAVVGMPDDDVNGTLSFINLHYFAAAATQFGNQAAGGYEYDGLFYEMKAPHVLAADTCIECHDAHSLALDLKSCATCHPAVTDYASLRTVRMAASTQDYDGDGNVAEGIAEEIDGLADVLYTAIQGYATGKGFPIVYSSTAYPYFFNDTDADGITDPGEATYGNRYNHWTPRLLKAGYNWQAYQKDPGGFAHNPKYIIELLYDSAADLGTVNLAAMRRNDINHFDTTREAVRHWDDDGLVDASCARCHSGKDGFRYYVANNFTNPVDQVPAVSRMACETCHTGTGFTAGNAPLIYVSKVVFPSPTSDLTIVFNDPLNPDPSFICMTCHQGRTSKKLIDAAIATAAAPGPADDDTVYATLGFLNVHYLSAGATLYGKQAGVAYEYPGKTYNLKFTHWGLDSAQCGYCHDISASRHTFLPRLTPVCMGCHAEVTGGDIDTLRLNRPYDYNGNGDTTETLKAEIEALVEVLYAEIQDYALTVIGQAIVYDGLTNPYWFKDTDGDGVADPGETVRANRFTTWTPRLIKAANNLQVAHKEPGDWAHNTNYVAQVLIDSIEDLGGNVSTYERPVGF